MSLPGVWFPTHSKVTCTGKGVEILPTYQRTRINSDDDFIGRLELLTL